MQLETKSGCQEAGSAGLSYPGVYKTLKSNMVNMEAHHARQWVGCLADIKYQSLELSKRTTTQELVPG